MTMETRTERRAARRAEARRKRSESPLLKHPFRPLRNPLPSLELIAPEQVGQLHAASLRLLEDVGLDFFDAEALAGIALTQLVRPGAPVIYGGFTTNVDMKSGSPAFGTPEGAWALIVGAQLARYYRLPYRGSGSLTTAKIPDAQAAYETQWTLWPCVLAHTNLVMHAVGWLEGGLTASYEKFIIDAESLAMFYHFLDGFTIDDETLALDMIKEVGPGGHHFGTPHTQARFSTEFYQTFLGDRLGYETWAAAGGWDAARRANAIWKDLLAQYEPPPLDPAIREAVHDFVARRERELEGKNLYQ